MPHSVRILPLAILIAMILMPRAAASEPPASFPGPDIFGLIRQQSTPLDQSVDHVDLTDAATRDLVHMALVCTRYSALPSPSVLLSGSVLLRSTAE